MSKPSSKASRQKKKRKGRRSPKGDLSHPKYSGGALQGMTHGMQSLFKRSPKGERGSRQWLIDLATISLVAASVAIVMWRCQ